MKSVTRFRMLLGTSLLLGNVASAGLIFSNLVSFDGTNGNYPSGLIQATNGLLYGTTFLGGDADAGTIFKVDADSILTKLVSLGGLKGANGGPLIQSRDGNLYGTTADAGELNYGGLWRMSLGGAFTNLVSFWGTNGAQPRGLTETSDGRIVGVTTSGGIMPPGYPASYGFGTIFCLSASGSISNLALFHGTNGIFPLSTLEDQHGNLVGCTMLGGVGFDGAANLGFGTLYSLSTNGELTTLACFDGTNGMSPSWSEGVVFGADETVCGVLNAGGLGFDGVGWSGAGAVFELPLTGGNANYHFLQVSNGANPSALLRASDGKLYGLAEAGGAANLGTIFRLTTTGLEVLHSFSGADGAHPGATLIQGADRNLYGVTSGGGAFNKGTIFRLSVPLQPSIAIEVTPTNSIRLSWDAVVGQVYQPQTSTNFVDWVDLGSFIPATNAAMSSVVNPSSTTSAAYRLVVLP